LIYQKSRLHLEIQSSCVSQGRGVKEMSSAHLSLWYLTLRWIEDSVTTLGANTLKSGQVLNQWKRTQGLKDKLQRSAGDPCSQTWVPKTSVLSRSSMIICIVKKRLDSLIA
jgi:hypothetical protein